MRLPKSRLARVAGSLLVIGAVAGSTLGVTTLLGVTFQGKGEAQQARVRGEWRASSTLRTVTDWRSVWTP